MVLLAVRRRGCLGSCCAGTLCLQLLLWILCAVNGEEQPFSVEVSTGTAAPGGGGRSGESRALPFPCRPALFWSRVSEERAAGRGGARVLVGVSVTAGSLLKAPSWVALPILSSAFSLREKVDVFRRNIRIICVSFARPGLFVFSKRG